MRFALLKVSAAIMGAALISGCAGDRVHKGAVVDTQLLGAVQVGVDNKASVEKTLGRPSFGGQFTSNDWYYVSEDTSQFAFRNPRVTKATVVHVKFDQAGNVVAVERTGKELMASVDPTHRKTPTLGRKKSFFEEIFGGIGSVGSGIPGASPGY